MKKILYVFVISIVMCLLVGCDRYWIKKPYQYPNSVWISETPYLEMKIDEEGDSKSKLILDGEMTDVEIAFMAESAICYPLDGENADKRIYANRYFVANCKFSKEKCVMKIIEKKEGILEGVDEIVLVNQAYKDKLD